MVCVAIYTRKSRSTDKGESIETQKKLCLEHINKIYLDEEVKIIYYDEGEGKSGGDVDREMFQKLRKDAKRKVYNVLMCYRLDRVARNVGAFSDLIEELSDNKINFISVKEQFDTTTPMGRAMMYTASVFAQLEREIGAERIKDNLRELAKSGRWLGGTAPTGYESEGYEIVTIKEVNNNNEVERKRKKAFKLKKIEEEGKLLEILFRKLEELQSLTKVETYLFNNDILTKNGNVFTRYTLLSIYRNIVYAKNDRDMYEYLKRNEITFFASEEDFDGNHGMIGYNKTAQTKHKAHIHNDIHDWIISVGKHEGYFSGKRWLAIQSILDRNQEKRYRKPRKNNSILSGILKCECSGYMRPKLATGRKDKDGNQRFFYLCETKELSRLHKCNIKNIDGNALDKELIKRMKEWFAPNSKIVKELKAISEEEQFEEESDEDIEINRLKKIYSKNQKDLSNLIDRIKYIDIDLIDDINGEIKKLKEENLKINQKINSLSNSKKEYKLDMPDSEIAKLVIDVIENYFDVFTEIDIMKQREMLKLFISSATWNGEKVIIDLLNKDSSDFFLGDLFPTGEYRKRNFNVFKKHKKIK